MTKSNNLSILHISDGKSGHDSAASNIICALERVHESDANIHKLEIRLKFKFLLPLMRLLINHKIFHQQLAKYHGLIDFFYEKKTQNNYSKTTYDYVVSGGGNTGYINAYLGKFHKIKNIYASRLRGLKPSLFWLLPTIYEDEKYPNAIYTEFSPSNKALSGKLKPKESLLKSYKITEVKPIYLLLFGGNGAGYFYQKEDFENTINGFLTLLERHDAIGLMSTSRRTGLNMERFLKEIIETSELKNRLKYSVFFNHEPEYIMQDFLSLSDSIFVTEDSGAMLIETLLTNKPVCTLRPKNANPTPIYKAFLNSKSKYISKSISGNELESLLKNDLKSNTIPSPIDTFDVQLKNFINQRGS